jgi:pimeloyl-ACP methyl ester carboxylesterase
LARLVGGRYPISDWLVDFSCFGLFVLALRLLDLGIKKAAHRLIGVETRTRKMLAEVARTTVVLFVAVPLLMALVQFHPQRIRCGLTPGDLRLPYSDVVFESDGVHLAGWHLPASSTERPVVVLCHGLGVNKQNFLLAAELVHALDYNVLLFDFRGHGDSEGRTTTFGYKESNDVNAAFAYASAKHPSSRIYGLGYSMGGSALLKMAAEHDGFDKIVVDGTFARAENVAKHSMLWFFGPLKSPVWHLARFWGWVFSGVDMARHNPEEYIPRIKCPVLIIHGAVDNLIPTSESVRLHEATANSSLWLVEGAGHLQTIIQPMYPKRLRDFLEGD